MSEYTPRPGSKVAAAFAALLDGPQPSAALATAMGCTSKNVTTMLRPATEHAALLLLKDETGLRHYALAGMPVDERFKADNRSLTEAPLVRRVTRHAPPSAAALAAANPFRRGNWPAVQDSTESSTPAPQEVAAPPEGPRAKPNKTARRVRRRVDATPPPVADPVHAPAHYTAGGIEVIEILRAKLSPEEFRGFCKGNIIKYTLRAELKNGAIDYAKASVYAGWLVAAAQGGDHV